MVLLVKGIKKSTSWTLLQNIGWGGWDRTSEWRIQSPLPYRLATPQVIDDLLLSLIELQGHQELLLEG